MGLVKWKMMFLIVPPKDGVAQDPWKICLKVCRRHKTNIKFYKKFSHEYLIKKFRKCN
jgi:hypothetical protein